MKIAFCLFNYFPYGGLQRDFLAIAKACHERGHEIHIYTMRWEGPFPPAYHLHLMPPRGWQNHTQIAHFAKQVQNDLKMNNYDLVVGFNKMPGLDVYYAADVCYQARVRTRRSLLHRLLPRYRQQVAFEKAVFAKNAHTAILLIAPNQQQEFVRFYQTDPTRFHVLPPGIARDRIAPENAKEIRAEMRQTLGIPDHEIILLMVGSGFKTKGLDRSLHALSALPEDLKQRCHLFVIGQDNPSSFQVLAKKLKVADRLHFLGGRKDVPHFLLAADFLLHPSYHENTGTVLLEAIISGLPVLTTAVCGYAHYVQSANAGIVLPVPFQQAKFNSALQTMLLSKEQDAWRENGLHFAKTADIYSMAERAADVIEQVGQKNVSCQPRSFEDFMALRGECFRQQPGRKTHRIQLGNEFYFIKQHTGIGWFEIFKNLFQGRAPVLGAKNEWKAIQKLESLNISVPKIASYGKRGVNPARQQSYILMKELAPVISLEDLCKNWQKTPPSFVFKQALIKTVATMARTLHQHGMNHRDFYICHFLLDVSNGMDKINVNQPLVHLIDLHRAQIRQTVPVRWLIKDLAGLYFSSKDIGLTKRDLYRFMMIYKQQSIRDIITSEKNFWKKVENRGEQLYRNHA